MKAHEVTLFCEDIKLAEFYSMADSSTTTWGIPILFAGVCWARRPLPQRYKVPPCPMNAHEDIVLY